MSQDFNKLPVRPAYGLLLAVLVFIAFSFSFFPGLNGPFVFDDFGNIILNDFIKIHRLDWSSLDAAARSGFAGPLGRPIPMISFAIDYYVSGGFDNTYPFKLTSLAVHFVNGLLVYFLAFRLLTLRKTNFKTGNTFSDNEIYFLSLATGLLWLLHPIQSNVVYFIVQRMTSLSAMFVLLSLITYVHARRLLEEGNNRRSAMFMMLAATWFVLGLYSKENAVLALPFAALIDTYFFREPLLLRWATRWGRKTFLLILASTLVVAAIAVIAYALPGYTNRDFSMTERILTEARVIAFYIRLILYPEVSQFGLFHDDFAISRGILSPPTTLFSIFGIVLFTAVAILKKDRWPFFSFGVFWFLVAHSLESSVIALELIHEHRNYLALLGIAFCLVELAGSIQSPRRNSILITIIACMLSMFSLISYLRANDWSSREQLLFAEAYNHPESARAQAGLASALASQGDYQNSLEYMSRAHKLKPGELGYALNIAILHAWSSSNIADSLAGTVTSLSRTGKLTPLSYEVLRYAVECSITSCKSIAPLVMDILNNCADRSDIPRRNQGQCLYYKGSLLLQDKQYRAAIPYLETAYQKDRNSIVALIAKGKALLKLGDLAAFEKFSPQLVKANKNARLSRDKEVANLIYEYSEIQNRMKKNNP